MFATSPSSRIARRPVQALAIVVGLLLVAVVALGWRFAEQGLRISVQESTEASNRTLTRVFVNETWDAVKPLLPPPGSGAEVAKANPNIAAVDQIVRRFSSYTDVMKVKIYDRGGITVYSSERGQIGEDKSRNAGFQAAARGEVASELTYRGQFGAFDGQIYDRNLVSTYVPVRVGERIEAVLEIYADRTASIEFVHRELRGLALWMVPWLLVALLVVAATAWWLHRTQLEAVRQLARVEAQAREREWQAMAGAAPAAAARQGLPTAVTDLEPLLARVRQAVPADAIRQDGASSQVDLAWGELLGRVEAIAGWARVHQDMALLEQPVQATPVAFDVGARIDEALAEPAARAQAAGLRLERSSHPQPIGRLSGDPALADAVVTHLVGASLDLAPRAQVQCKALWHGAGLHIDVLDDTAGLEQDVLDRWCADWDRTALWPVADGAGLAGRRLVLVRALVRRAGGRFDARGTPGHGNRWSVVLPLAPVDPPA